MRFSSISRADRRVQSIRIKTRDLPGLRSAARARLGAGGRPRDGRPGLGRKWVRIHLGRPGEPMTSSSATPLFLSSYARRNKVRCYRTSGASSQVQERRNVVSRAGITRGNLSYTFPREPQLKIARVAGRAESESGTLRRIFKQKIPTSYAIQMPRVR